MPDDQPDAGNAAVLRRLVERLPTAAVSFDGERLFVNRAASAITGYDPAELSTLDAWFTALHPGEADAARAAYQREREDGFPRPKTGWLVRKDGDERFVEFAAWREPGVEVWLLRDLTDSQRSARLMAQTARTSGVGGWELDCRNNRLFWSEETYRLHEVDPADYTPGVETAIAYYAQESVPVIIAAVRRGIEQGDGFDLELELLTAKGRRIWVRSVGVVEREDGRTVRLYGSFQDISEQKKAEEARAEREKFERHLLETQKLESLGVLAGGVAHDFNNLLTAILGNAELARLSLGDRAAAERSLSAIEEASERAADLCRQMLAYAGKGRFVIESVDLAALVRRSVPLLQVSVSKRASLTVCVPERLPAVRADAAQLNQVLMNLVINASEAIGEGEGLIAVAAHVETIDAEALRQMESSLASAVVGEYVCLEVADTGAGMSAETRARIFEPFFTTKFTGRGLGLAAVLGIVRAHGGLLRVDSAADHGTTFRVYFPPADGVAAPREEEDASQWRGEGLVLVADDEEQVRAAVSLCATLGFDAVEAGDGREALRMLEKHPAVRLVLLDWAMPRLDGAAALREIRRRWPGLPVVVMSGYSEVALHERFDELGASALLEKPFRIEQMRRRLREALDKQGSRQ